MRYLLVGLLFLLVSCAGPKSATQINIEKLLPQLSQLPGATVSTGEGLSFSYSGQAMFGTHAVLPLPGGPKLLNPLAEFLKQNPQIPWQVDVRAQTIYGTDYDQLLAEKRSELLATYLLNKGVKLQNLHFEPSSEDGEPLVFTLILPEKQPD